MTSATLAATLKAMTEHSHKKDKQAHDLEIRLILHGGLGGSPPLLDGHVVVVPHGTSLAGALGNLGIDHGLVGVASSLGMLLRPDSILEADSIIHIYPLFGGG